ncbi:MAG TPA: carboxypeptidase regulatory-like domain-containing protein [Vicinamibacterales bacterium]|nr:carboxypeptidase regulatory-like domain-containing protein [Vicinamibacterales bacterium]
MAYRLRHVFILLAVGLVLLCATVVSAQTTTYRLHNEDSGDFFCFRSLKLATADAAAVGVQSTDLKNKTGTATFACFQTMTAPANGGTIPSGSTITFTVSMKKTSNWGTIFPYAEARLASGTLLCSATGSTAMSTSSPNPLFQFSCTTGAAISVTTTDRFRVHVGYSISPSNPPGNHSVKAQLDFETGFDSRVTLPDPIPAQISSLSVTAAPLNWTVTISGTRFGTTGTVKFGTVVASPTPGSWTDTSIAVPVPAGLTVGTPVVVSVTVNGSAATCPGNNCTFTLKDRPALTTITPAAAHRGDVVTIVGANFMATQSSSTVTFGGVAALAADTSTWNDTTIVTKVPPTATDGPAGVTVSGQTSSNTLAFTVLLPGTISGTITKAVDATALQGATVQAVQTGAIKGTATSAANGSYTIGNLDPGTYDVRVLATGYSSEVRSLTLANGGTSNANVPMSHPGSISGQVTAGATPLPGAAVTMFLNGMQKATGNADGSGNYSLTGLHPGSYTLQVVNVGYRTKEQAVVVNDNANTSANVSLDAAPAGPVQYAYDALGRLTQVTDPSGDAAIYRYDAVGNIVRIERTGVSVVSISSFTPTSGAVGATVTISGTGFSSTPGLNTVTFGCAGTGCRVSATVTSATATQLVVTVPATAETSVIAVTAQAQTVDAPSSFGVTATASTPTISGFTPTLAAAGNSLSVTGTGFDPAPANDRLTTNLASAQVTAATATSLTATVPVTSTGRVSLTTPNGSVTSTDYLWVVPAPYAVGNVDSTGLIAFDTPTAVQINSPGKFLMRAFESTQGHRASVHVTGAGAFQAGGTVAIYGAYANPASTGFAGTGFLEPVELHTTGTYTLLFAPNGSYQGNATITVYDVPPDQTGPIVPGTSKDVSIGKPGQNARFTFAGTANQRVCIEIPMPPPPPPTAIASGVVRVLRPDGTTLKFVNFNSAGASFLDTVAIPATGAYTVLVDPNTVNTGSASLTLRTVEPDTTGSVSMNGDPVPVPLAIGQNGTLTFTGSQNQTVTVHATGNTFGSGSVAVKLLSSDGQTVLSQSVILGTAWDLPAVALPTPGTATYTILIDPTSAAMGTLNISVSGS